MILWLKLIGRSLCLGLCWTATYFLFASGQKRNVLLCLLLVALRYSCVPASRGAVGHGLHRLCLNPPLFVRLRSKIMFQNKTRCTVENGMMQLTRVTNTEALRQTTDLFQKLPTDFHLMSSQVRYIWNITTIKNGALPPNSSL
jgi:hypothetical protein